MFASTMMGGMCFAMPDTCNVPAPPAPPIPTPFPNIGQCPMALPPTCSMKVMISNQMTMTINSKILRTNGDEAGVLGGLACGMFGGEAGYVMGSTKVMAEGNPVVRSFDPTKQNGASPNAMGSQLVPSQFKVLVM